MAANATLTANGTRSQTQPTQNAGQQWYTPRVDVVETEDDLILFADLPGVKNDDVEIHFENGELFLQARCGHRQSETRYLVNEYGVGDYYRAFTINQDVDADKISADLKNGVLTVHLPKSAAVKPRRIPVKGN
jgi:HSP20 family protein